MLPPALRPSCRILHLQNSHQSLIVDSTRQPSEGDLVIVRRGRKFIIESFHNQPFLGVCCLLEAESETIEHHMLAVCLLAEMLSLN